MTYATLVEGRRLRAILLIHRRARVAPLSRAAATAPRVTGRGATLLFIIATFEICCRVVADAAGR
jgi:hypothetical protein